MIIDIIGWIGTILVLAAYYLISNEKVKPADNLYNLMNLFGAFFIGVNVLFNHAWPAVALNTVWAGVAIISLVKGYRSRGESKR